MIQINLLPDVKTKYIKTEHTKRLVIISAAAISILAIAVVVIMVVFVYGYQNTRLNSLSGSIKKNSSKLQQTNNLDKILTIQYQLNSLSSLHGQKPVTTRLFDFLQEITPNNVQISSFTINFAASTIEIQGTAPTLSVINQFVDTLKFTGYTTNQNQNQTSAFSQVVLTSYSRSATSASYTIDMNYDPTIFSSQNNVVTLSVPSTTTTRSEINTPNSLFKAQPDDNNNTGQ